MFLHLLGDDGTSSLWHLSNSERAFTLCGIDVGYANPRLPWADTPVERRCEVCLGQLGGERAQG